MDIRLFVLATAFIAAIVVKPQGMLAADTCDLPAWNGTVIIDCESGEGWNVEASSGSTGTIEEVPTGLVGQAIRLNYQLSPSCAGWVQARYDFDQPTNFADFDLFGVSLHGVPTLPGTSNRIRIMVADTKNVFFGATIGDIAHVNRWVVNMPVPGRLFTHQSWSFPPPIDWTQINRLFVVVEPAGADSCIQAGLLTIDHIQATRSADWEAPDEFVSVAPDAAVAQKAVDYVLTQLCPSTGLFRSWSDDLEGWGWLYDQALALLMLTRESRWAEADQLATRLVQEQEVEGEQGHWAIAWNYCDPAIERLDEWAGDQAWTAFALHRYAIVRRNKEALQASIRSGNWLAQRIRPDGCVDTSPRGTASTEGNFDVWMAMMQLGRTDDADRIAECLLTTLWDNNMRYWPRGEGDPVVALNANTWTARGFALHPRINRPDMARNALSFVRRSLATRSDPENACKPDIPQLCGLDFQVPITLHAEGMASYVVAGGPESHEYLDTIQALQEANGGVQGSSEDWTTDTHWLTCWKGIAPTAWLYFAVDGSPFVDAPKVLYVDGNASGSFHDGSTWCNALGSLQDALATAASSNGVTTEIRVANGVYCPDQGERQTAGDREATLQLLSGAALRGGYAGCGAPNPDLRDIEANPSILSGDLERNDVPVACTQDSPDCDSFGGLCVDNFCIIADNNGENSFHVVTGSGTDATAVFDGFTITAGTADDSDDCCLNVRGAGMYNDAGSPTVINCTFRGNSANVWGSGMANVGDSSPTVTNCTFSGNSGTNFGGGMSNENSSPMVTNCTFTGNATGIGGGMSNIHSSPTVNKCTFSGNAAGVGGGMTNDGVSKPTLANCTFIGNAADFGGGGMANVGNSSSTAFNCTFSGNSAGDSGGGMYNNSSSPTLTNCTFSENTANVRGGGMYSEVNPFFGGTTIPTVTNCILWGNRDGGGTGASAQIHDEGTSKSEVNYSCVLGAWSGNGANNIDDDPLFGDADGLDDIVGTEDDNLRVRSRSPCVDAGSNAAVPLGITTDLDGNPRFVDNPRAADMGNGPPPIVDMGAFEFQPGDCVIDVLEAVWGQSGRVDLVDYAGFETCLGELGDEPPGQCECFDLDGGGSVDLLDFAVFQVTFRGG